MLIAMCTFSGNSPTGSQGTAERARDGSNLISGINMNIILGKARHLHLLSKHKFSDLKFFSFSDVECYSLGSSNKCVSPRDLHQFKCKDLCPLSNNLQTFVIIC